MTSTAARSSQDAASTATVRHGIKTRHTVYLATVPVIGGGYWAFGETAEEARQKVRGQRGANRKNAITIVYRFDSALPFAEPGQEPEPDQAAAWVDGTGGVNWLRCNRVPVHD